MSTIYHLEATRIILDDIFGQQHDTVFVEGLVDSSDSDDFQIKLDSLFEKWRDLETSSSEMEAFIQYFVANKVNVIRTTMLRPIMEDCGLGNPPEIFTTNASESVNALLKHKVDYKRNDLPVLIEKIKQLIDEQQNELQRAVGFKTNVSSFMFKRLNGFQ